MQIWHVLFKGKTFRAIARGSETGETKNVISQLVSLKDIQDHKEDLVNMSTEIVDEK